MGRRSFVLAVATFLLAASSGAAQDLRPDSPQAAALQYFELVRAENWGAVAEATHPDALQHFRELFAPVIAADETGRFARFFGITDADGLKKAPARDLFIGVMRTLTAAPEFKGEFAGTKTQVLGCVSESEDVAHVVVRQSGNQAHAAPEADLVSFRRREGRWLALLTRRIEEMVDALAFVIPAKVASEPLEAPEPSRATVKLLRVTPAPGSVVTKDTVIVAELAYSVERFRPEAFIAMVRAAEKTPGWTTMGSGEFEQPVLSSAQGTIKLTYPLKAIWDNVKVKRPFELEFSINQLFGTWGASAVAAETAPIVYIPAPPR